ncbi:MAG: hypothetical protein HY064_02705 [Bacteroidetes bacterium]|nr:hypothetical protein [Bacteroidota bacterium]
MNKSVREMKLDLCIRMNDLIVSYLRSTEKCSWSIFDEGGVELKKGMIQSGSTHVIGLGNIAPGFYQLCVIDGDQLHNSRFRLP